jgi:hypothetical protein
LCLGAPDRGTRLTLRLAQAAGRPHRVFDLGSGDDVVALRGWLAELPVLTLNVAGPRESRCPGIRAAATAALRRLLE